MSPADVLVPTRGSTATASVRSETADRQSVADGIGMAFGESLPDGHSAWARSAQCRSSLSAPDPIRGPKRRGTSVMTKMRFAIWSYWPLTLLAVGAAQAQSSPDLLGQFREEAPKQWQRYEAFSTGLQGTIHRRATITFPDRKLDNEVDEIRYMVKQNPRSALLGGQPIKRSKNDSAEYYFLANSQYSAELRR